MPVFFLEKVYGLHFVLEFANLKMRTNPKEMTAKYLQIISQIFLGSKNISEKKLARFSLDIFFPNEKIAYEYDGPDHYDKVANHERDLRKSKLCKDMGIELIRWPYYFQLTKDIARYVFKEYYTDDNYVCAINTVYGTTHESEILAPGLHNSKLHQRTLLA